VFRPFFSLFAGEAISFFFWALPPFRSPRGCLSDRSEQFLFLAHHRSAAQSVIFFSLFFFRLFHPAKLVLIVSPLPPVRSFGERGVVPRPLRLRFTPFPTCAFFFLFPGVIRQSHLLSRDLFFNPPSLLAANSWACSFAGHLNLGSTSRFFHPFFLVTMSFPNFHIPLRPPGDFVC